jgi:hypothetical protein
LSVGTASACLAREGKENELAEPEPMTERTFGNFVLRANEKASGITKDAVVNVCVFHNRMRVVPVTVENKGDPKDDGEDENGSKHEPK